MSAACCTVCSEPMLPKSGGGGRPRRYCSPDCKRIAQHVARFGHPPAPRRGPHERLMGFIAPDASGCWLWTGHIDAQGYGRFFLDGAHGAQLAHRAAYKLLKGEIPNDLALDHLCCVRSCVNPEHLEPVTHEENSRRGSPIAGARAATCREGHPWTPENTAYWGSRPRRFCRTCNDLRNATARKGGA